MSERIAFIGIGAMGGPMAAHLARAGHQVVVHDLDRTKVAEFVAAGLGEGAADSAAAAAGATILITSVTSEAGLAAVTIGPRGAYETLAHGAVHVDHSTVSAEASRRIGAAGAARGIAYLDAPVTGSEEGARAAAVSAMVGGEAAALDRVRPVLGAYCRDVRHLGPVGAGQIAKMANTIVTSGFFQGLIEGLTLAHKAGLEPQALVAALAASSAQSWWLEARAPLMLGHLAAGRDINTGRAGMMLKDLGITLIETRHHDIGLPLAALASQLPVKTGRG